MQRELRSERQSAESFDKGHGRREHRRLTSSTTVNDHLNWPDVKQVCQLTRTTWRSGRQTTEVQYALTSVPRQLADASQLLTYWRRHWHIENRLHWVRDVTFAEDACRVRTGWAPQNLSAVRNAAISLLRLLRVDNIAAALREHAYKVDRLFAKLTRWNH